MGAKVFLLRSTIFAACLGLGALVYVLPYVALVVGAWLAVRGLPLSEEQLQMLRDALKWLPNRRTRSLEADPENNPLEIVAVIVAMGLGALASFRTHRSALRFVGHGDTGRFWMLFFPSFTWISTMTPAAAVGVILVLGPHFILEMEWIYAGNPKGLQLDAYAMANQWAIGLVAAGVIVTLAPLGCRAVQIAAAEPLPFSTYFLGFGSLLALGVVQGALAVPLSFGLVHLTTVLYGAVAGAPLEPGLAVYLGAQAAVHWMAMSIVCVLVLERAINRFAEAAEAAGDTASA